MYHQKIRTSIKISSKIYVVVCCGTRMVSFTLLYTLVEILIGDYIWNNCHSFHNLADINKMYFRKRKYWCVLLIQISFGYAVSGSIKNEFTLIRVVVWRKKTSSHYLKQYYPQTIFLCIRIPIIKLRRSWDRLIFIKGNPWTDRMVSLYWTTSHTFSVLTPPNIGLESLYITVVWWRHQMETFSA